MVMAPRPIRETSSPPRETCFMTLLLLTDPRVPGNAMTPGNASSETRRSHCWTVCYQHTPRLGFAAYPGGVDSRDEVKAFLSSRRAKVTHEQAGLVVLC